MAGPRSVPRSRPTDSPARLTAAFAGADGRPRFVMLLPRTSLEDAGIKALVRGETERGGYEYPLRAFLDAHLQPGDVFVDVGAHWGIFSLHAATRHPGRIRVLAIEAHPQNAAALLRQITANGLGSEVEVIAAAAGHAPGTAPLLLNSTMAHSLFGLGLPPGVRDQGRITVPVLPLDLLWAERADLGDRRVFLKIDVEGFEPEVIEGARALLASGRVAAVIWEQGLAFRAPDRQPALTAMADTLAEHGFRSFRFPHPTMGGPLVPYVPTPECTNVLALARDFCRLPVYEKPQRRPEPLPPLERATADADVRAALTERLIAARATEAARWADFEAMGAGAADRAAQAAPLIAAGARVLDLGAGVMALKAHLPQGCVYVPADLLPFAAETVVVDLNQGPFPAGTFDVVVVLNTLEFLHDPGAILSAAAVAATDLVVSYRPADGQTAAARRRLGYVNDLTAAAYEGLLDRSGWRVERRIGDGNRLLFACVRR